MECKFTVAPHLQCNATLNCDFNTAFEGTVFCTVFIMGHNVYPGAKKNALSKKPFYQRYTLHSTLQTL